MSAVTVEASNRVVLASGSYGQLVVDEKPEGTKGVLDKKERIVIVQDNGKVISNRVPVDAQLIALGIDWVPKGTDLAKVATYIDLIQRAKEHASEGNTSLVESAICFAELRATETGIVVADDTIADIQHLGVYQNMINGVFSLLKDGNPLEARKALNKAEGYARNHGMDFDTIDLRKEIRTAIKEERHRVA